MSLLTKLKEMFFSGGDSEFKNRLKEAQLQAKIERTVQERQMSGNERALRSEMARERELVIEQELKAIRQRQNEEMWRNNSILNGGASILKSDKPKSNVSILRDNPNFMSNGSIFMKKQKKVYL